MQTSLISGWFLFLLAAKCSPHVRKRPPGDPKVHRSSPSERADDFRRLMAKLVEQVLRSWRLQRFRLFLQMELLFRRQCLRDRKRKVRDAERERRETLPVPTLPPPETRASAQTDGVCVCEMTPVYRRMRLHGSRGVNSQPLIHEAFLFSSIRFYYSANKSCLSAVVPASAALLRGTHAAGEGPLVMMMRMMVLAVRRRSRHTYLAGTEVLCVDRLPSSGKN